MNVQDHASFFSAAEGYGLFKQTLDGEKLSASIAVSEGRLRVAEIILSADGKNPTSASVTLAGEAVEAKLEVKDGEVRLKLPALMTIKANQRLDIEVN